MTRNLILKLLAHFSAALICRTFEYDERERIHFLAVDENIQFYQLGFLVAL